MHQRTLFALFVSLFVFSLARAEPPRGYIGITAAVNRPTGFFADNDLDENNGGASQGGGGEFDMGLSGKIYDAYLGYRFSSHDASGVAGYSITATGEWGIRQWIMGFRLHPAKSFAPLIAPEIGGGISFSTASVKATADMPSGYPDFSDRATSESNLGWFIELGFKILIARNLSILTNYQHHEFDAVFSTEIWDGTVPIEYSALQLGLAYRL